MNPADYATVPDPVEGRKPAKRQGMDHAELQASLEADKIRFLHERARHIVAGWKAQGHRPRPTAEQEVFQKLKAEYLEKKAENELRRARQEESRRRQAEARLEAIQRREIEIEEGIDQASREELAAVVRAFRAFIADQVARGRLRPSDVPEDLK